MIGKFAVSAIAAAAFTCAASAQDVSLPPTFGEVELAPGFLPDPYEVSVIAGGSNDASVLGGACAGFIADAPDFRLYYGGSGSLGAGARSNADTTIVINAPDGSWFCNDDADGLDPFFGGGGAQAGQYDIWIGTFGGTAEAVLYITEFTD